jgi:hypothetical protein
VIGVFLASDLSTRFSNSNGGTREAKGQVSSRIEGGTRMRSLTSWFNVGAGIVMSLAVGVVRADAGLIVLASGAGSAPADVTAARDAFRAAVGGGTVAGANGSFGGLRREINWDGVPDAFSSPNALPSNFFNANSPRGAVFATPGSGFLVSADSSNPTGTPVRFAEQNPAYASQFQAFSAERLFAVAGSTTMDINFFVPGTATPASVTAFGAVFVDNSFGAFPSCASIQAFNGAQSLGFFCAPIAPAGGLSFLGLGATGGDVFTRIRLNLGTGLLGSTQSATNEVVVMDDFLYSEPRAVPEPTTLALGLVAAAGLLARARRRR